MRGTVSYFMVAIGRGPLISTTVSILFLAFSIALMSNVSSSWPALTRSFCVTLTEKGTPSTLPCLYQYE